jgi:hypothetical protein
MAMAAQRLTSTGARLKVVREEDVAPPIDGRQLLIRVVVPFLAFVSIASRRSRARRRHWVVREQAHLPFEARSHAPVVNPPRAPQKTIAPRRRRSLGNEPMTRKQRLLSKKLQLWRLPKLPATYGECLSLPRPCYRFLCRHHLMYDINPESGSLVENFPGLEPHQLKYTCSLDAALEGAPPGSAWGQGHTLEQVGEFLNVTLERARQTEEEALAELRAKLEDLPRDLGTDEVDEFEDEEGDS